MSTLALFRAGLAVALGALCCSGAPAQQRTLLPITSAAEEHAGALLSPDGDWIAYRGPGPSPATSKVGVVNYRGGTEFTAASSANLGSFVWAPDSTGLYYLDGRELRYVTRTGGQPRLVVALPETSHALWTVKRNGTDLFGTWLYLRTNGSTTIRETQIFAIATDGASAPRVLVQSVLVVDGVRLSPDEARMVYREYDATPFSRRDYIVANIDGTSPVSLTGGLGLGLNPELPSWLPDGTGIVFARIDRNLSRAVIERLTLANPTPDPLTFTTPARNVTVSADGQWIAYEGWWPHGSTWTPVVMPALGGGHVFLDPSRALVFAGAPMLGGPTGDHLIVSGTLGAAQHTQVLKVELAREILVTPRAEVGGAVDVDVPVVAGESCVVFLAAAPLPVAIPVIGLVGGFQLDPTVLVVLISGTGSGQGSLHVQVPIPNLQFLRRKALYLQSVRLTSAVPTGDFTRLVELPIF